MRSLEPWLLTASLLIPLLAGACSPESEGRPDSELGNLVVSPPKAVHEVDLDKAAGDADALLAAVLLPHAWLGETLGAHVVRGSTSVLVREGDLTLEQLDETLELEFDGEDRFRGVLENSKEYGRHALFDGKDLYLRPRFGLYHARAPQTETEAAQIRNEMTGGVGDYLALLSKGLEISDRGAKTRDGRAVREIALQLAPNPRTISKETLTQKLWRNSIEVKTLSGLVALDVETGVAIFVQLEGSIGYQRDGRNFVMSMQAKRNIVDVGHSRAVAAPAAEEIMRIGARRRALGERDRLLKNIAPPARKAPTPATRASGASGANP